MIISFKIGLRRHLEMVKELRQQALKKVVTINIFFDKLRVTIKKFLFLQELKEVNYAHCEIPPMPLLKSKLQNMLYHQELARFR